jgi:type IVB pilus formation R64 PilN family outer membrane protein
MRRLFSLSLVALAISGCAGFSAQKETIERRSSLEKNDIASAQQTLDAERAASSHKSIVEDVNRPFVGNKQVVATKVTQMPVSLRPDSNLTMSFADGHPDGTGMVILGIQDFANHITLATGIPTRVKADSLAIDKDTPVTVTLRPDFHGSLTPVFNQLQARYRVHVSYDDGVLSFYRTVTRTFLVGSPPGDTDMSVNTASGGNESGFSASVATNTKAVFRSAAGVVASVKHFLSPNVEPVLNEATGTMTITDTPEAIEAVAAFMKNENRLMVRQIRFDVKVIRYNNNNNGSSGVDWSALYTKIQALSGGTFQLSGPASGIGSGTGGIGITAVPGNNQNGKFNGSDFFLQALNTQGDTDVLRNTSLATVNRKPVMQAFNNTFDYVNQTTASTTQAGVATGQQTKTENVGRVVFLTPAIISEQEALVDLSIKESIKNPFGTNTIGSGQSQQTVQLLNKDTDVIREQLVMHDGETRVIESVGEGDTDGKVLSLDKNVSALLGGLAQGDRTDTKYFILLTMTFLN